MDIVHQVCHKGVQVTQASPKRTLPAYLPCYAEVKTDPLGSRCWYCGSRTASDPCSRCGGPLRKTRKREPIQVIHVDRPGRSASAYLSLVGHMQRKIRG